MKEDKPLCPVCKQRYSNMEYPVMLGDVLRLPICTDCLNTDKLRLFLKQLVADYQGLK